MTLISSKEFAADQEKYFDMALNEDVYIERGGNMFYLLYKTASKEQVYLEPDDDLRNAISGDEFKRRALEIVEKVHNRYYPK